MKLKTLRDLPCIRNEEYSCCNGDKSKHGRGTPWTDDLELKQEAIKWIKKFKSEMDDKNYDATHVLIQWIKFFFNIKEEEINVVKCRKN